jgi:hypothetical protein
VKKCTKCGEEKPATTEYFPRFRDGLNTRCKVCKNEYAKKWRVRNDDHIKQYRKDNSERGRMQHSKERSRKLGVKIIEDVYPSQVLEKWGTDCHICNNPVGDNWDMEHVIPRSHPDCTHTLDNIKPAHPTCNMKKGSNLL